MFSLTQDIFLPWNQRDYSHTTYKSEKQVFWVRKPSVSFGLKVTVNSLSGLPIPNESCMYTTERTWSCERSSLVGISCSPVWRRAFYLPTSLSQVQHCRQGNPFLFQCFFSNLSIHKIKQIEDYPEIDSCTYI
jgi:hypothetical protein